MTMKSLWTAASGMAAQQTNMDVIANNLANANTVGFKRSRANFEDMMYENTVAAGAQTSAGTTIPTGIQIGTGTKTTSVDKLFQQGSFTETDNPLDLAVQGNGFFQILRGSQQAYTRNGSFKVDQNGNVVDASGYQLQPSIQVPKTAVTLSVDASGVFTASDATGKVLQTSQIQLYNFPNPAGLQSVGQNYFIPTQASGEVSNALPGGPEGMGTILEGFLESSNINVVDEMVNMILSQRTYEANSKVIKSADEMLQMANNVVR
ncbi:flagellar component of cell-distal portion of basal-body rod [Syntrophobacter sp. SbD1]|nr:flagellar component of cell-distal portion of basal-body rod [Syntrophobacter sp. SbD1]